MKIRFGTISIVSLSVCLYFSESNAQDKIRGREIKTAIWKSQKIKYVEGQIVIKTKAGTTLTSLTDALDSVSVLIQGGEDDFGLAWLQVPEGADMWNLIDQIGKNPLILYAEPHMVNEVHAEPNDPYFKGTSPATYSYQWALKNTAQNPPAGTVDADIDAPEAWNITTGNTSVLLAILDSGIPLQSGTLSHPDLKDPQRILLGPDYIDTPPADLTVKDQLGHGTHVAGIAAAQSNNAVGIAGIAGGCKILVIQVFDAAGFGSDSALFYGVKYAVDYQRNNPGTKVVINFSGGGPASVVKESAVQYANTYGVVLCASSGNAGSDPDGSVVKYPAHYSSTYSNVIAVGSTDHNDVRTVTSDYGPQLNITAPGGYSVSGQDSRRIFSTVPNYSTTIFGGVYNYAYLNGTSMAAPHVTGTVGLMLSLNPNLTAQQIRDILQFTADDVPAMYPDTFTNEYGHGRLNAYKALLAVGPEITSPISCTALTPGTQVTISWKSNTSGRSFEIRLSTDGGQTYPTVIQGSVTSGTTDYSYIWTVPTQTSNNCRIKITDGASTGYSNKSCAFGINTAFIPATPTNFSVSNNNGHPELKWAVVADAAGYYLWRASSEYNPPYTWYKFKTLTGNGWNSYTDNLVTISNPNPHTMKYKMESYTACSAVSPQTSELSIDYSEFMEKGDHSMDQIQHPFTFDLSQNYPNPFNPETEISFELPEPSHVRITVSDILGRTIVTLVDGKFSEGYQKVTWKGTDGSGIRVGSGVYFYRIVATGQSGKQFTNVMKMLLTK